MLDAVTTLVNKYADNEHELVAVSTSLSDAYNTLLDTIQVIHDAFRETSVDSRPIRALKGTLEDVDMAAKRAQNRLTSLRVEGCPEEVRIVLRALANTLKQSAENVIKAIDNIESTIAAKKSVLRQSATMSSESVGRSRGTLAPLTSTIVEEEPEEVTIIKPAVTLKEPPALPSRRRFQQQ